MNEFEEDKSRFNTNQSEADNFILEKGNDLNQKNELNNKKSYSQMSNSPSKISAKKSLELLNSPYQNENDQLNTLTKQLSNAALRNQQVQERKKIMASKTKQTENRNSKSVFFTTTTEPDDIPIFKQTRTSLSKGEQYSTLQNKQSILQKNKYINSNQEFQDNDIRENKKSLIVLQDQSKKRKDSSSLNMSFYLKIFRAVVSRSIHPKVYNTIKDLASFDNQKGKNKSIPASQKQRQILSIMFEQKYRLRKKMKKMVNSINNFSNSIFQCLDTYIPVFDPTNKIKLAFDILIMISIMMCVFINTLQVSFQIYFFQLYTEVYPILDWSLLGLLFLDIFLKFNTGIYDQENIQLNRKEIFRHYYKGSFIIDAISMLSFVVLEDEDPIISNIFGLLILFRSIAHSNQKHMKMYYVIELIRLVLIIFFVAHYVAIIFYGQILLTQYFGIDDEINWVSQSTLVSMEDDWYKRYIFSLYFSVTTMMTVGYGDISPKNHREACIGIISMVIACGVFAYSFNLIGSIIGEMNRQDEQFKEQMKKVHIFLQDKNIDKDLKQQVHRHLEYRYKNVSQLSKEEEEEVLQGLSANLLSKINFQIKSKTLDKANKIFNHFSVEIRDQLCLKLKEIRTNKEEVIFEQETISDNPEMYFIQRGCIEIYLKNKTSNKESILNVLQDGQYFGEMSFFTNNYRISSARSKESSVIFSLSQQDFLSVLENDKQELEKFHLIYSKLVFGESNQYISQKCYQCNKESHMINKCPQLHYQPDKELLILKNSFSTTIKQRNEYDRTNKKQNSLKIQFEVEEYMQLLRQNNFFYDDDHLSDFFLNFDNQLRFQQIESDTPNENKKKKKKKKCKKQKILKKLIVFYKNKKENSFEEYGQDVISTESLSTSQINDNPGYSQIDEEDDESKSSLSKSSQSSSSSSELSQVNYKIKEKGIKNQLEARLSAVDSFNSIPDEESEQKYHSLKQIDQEEIENNKQNSSPKKQVVNKVRHKTVKQKKRRLDNPQTVVAPENKKNQKHKNKGSDNQDETIQTSNKQQNSNQSPEENNLQKQILDKYGRKEKLKTLIQNSKLSPQRKSIMQGQDRMQFNQSPQQNSINSIRYNLLKEQCDQAQQIMIGQRENDLVPSVNVPYLVIPQYQVLQNKQYNIMPDLVQNNKRASIFYQQHQNLIPQSPMAKRASVFYQQSPNLIPQSNFKQRASILQQNQLNIPETPLNRRASLMYQQQFNFNPETLTNKRGSQFNSPQKLMFVESPMNQISSPMNQQVQSLFSQQQNQQIDSTQSALSKNQQAICSQLQGAQIILEEEQQKEIILDKMQDYKYYYPAYNCNSIIQLYNKMRSTQYNKVPPYFNVYSFVIRNSKNVKKLRSLPVMQPSKKKTIFLPNS